MLYNYVIFGGRATYYNVSLSLPVYIDFLVYLHGKLQIFKLVPTYD